MARSDEIRRRRRAIEQPAQPEVTLAGRKFTIRKQFLDDLAVARLTDYIAQLKRPHRSLRGPPAPLLRGVRRASEASGPIEPLGCGTSRPAALAVWIAPRERSLPHPGTKIATL